MVTNNWGPSYLIVKYKIQEHFEEKFCSHVVYKHCIAVCELVLSMPSSCWLSERGDDLVIIMLDSRWHTNRWGGGQTYYYNIITTIMGKSYLYYPFVTFFPCFLLSYFFISPLLFIYLLIHLIILVSPPVLAFQLVQCHLVLHASSKLTSFCRDVQNLYLKNK